MFSSGAGAGFASPDRVAVKGLRQSPPASKHKTRLSSSDIGLRPPRFHTTYPPPGPVRTASLPVPPYVTPTFIPFPHFPILALSGMAYFLADGEPAPTDGAGDRSRSREYDMAYPDKRIGEAYVSPQIETTLGSSQREWLEDPVRWHQQVHPDDKSRWSIEAAETWKTMFRSHRPICLTAKKRKLVCPRLRAA